MYSRGNNIVRVQGKWGILSEGSITVKSRFNMQNDAVDSVNRTSDCNCMHTKDNKLNDLNMHSDVLNII